MLSGVQRRRGARAACAAAVVVLFLVGAVPASGASGGSLSGRVTDASGNPLSGICVAVEKGPNAETDAAGAYVIDGLTTGSYKVQYSDCSSAPQYL
ncbi:MAG: Carboxypeptidase regulatory-like domain, partial [Actinomycetota bacterium]|nr:Carboxypeptidase regulatory-like domain [Actinomycetota bacterium]